MLDSPLGRFTRRFARRDDGVAMLMVLMAMLVASSLSVLVLGVIVAQVGPSQFGKKNTRTVTAAEAGLDAGLSEIRTALAAPNPVGTVYGDRSLLPCTVDGPVSTEADNLTFSVQIRYYTNDPSGQPDSWLNSNEITCTPGSGVPVIPNFALIDSTGAANGVPGRASQSGDRSIQTVYTFQVENRNVAGGLFRTFNEDYCLQAPSDNPAVGSRVTYQLCLPGDPRQLWAYRNDYSIVLTSTLLTGGGGLCIQAAPGVDASLASLQTCSSGLRSQQWAFWNGAQMMGFGATNETGQCFYPGANTFSAGAELRVATTGCAGGYPNYGAWSPDAKVGAGNAGAATVQLVNYEEFGRCFDITNWNVGSGYMILFPCKQDPTEQVGWNQRLYYDGATSQLYVICGEYVSGCTGGANMSRWCVTAPAAEAGRVTMQLCTSAANQQWVRNIDTGVYATSYTFVDLNGRCLSTGPKGTASEHRNWSTITSKTCTGTGEQKWNAPPDAIDAATKDTQETTSRS